jgi:NADH-quinone oxidoreductase subunit G
MTKIIVDGKEVDVPAEYTLLQACEAAGAEIPRFCFHERLSIAGNCRMCLVELKGAPKPVASCAWGVRDCRPGPNGEPPTVVTKSPLVKKAREGVMEFLLINHPLDCPICDQGGECDLQDQAMAFGVDSSRFAENKRAVEDKYIGPLVKTSMNRCIHCTRCVRFTAEVAGTSDMGAIGRGEDMEITTYLETAMASELQGNVADLCPVGALLHKPYSFKARPWELGKIESIDVMDAVGSAIRVDVRGREVMRILRENGRLRPASWAEAFAAVAAKVKSVAPAKVGALAGDLASVEEMFALKLLMEKLGSPNLDCRQDGTKLDPKNGRASYVFSPTIAGIEDADALLIIGANPRREAAVLNARIRKRWRMGGFPIGVVGERVDLSYDYKYLGAGADTLNEIANGGGFGEALANAKRPIVIVGQGALSRADGAAILALAAKIAKPSADWNGLAVLHTAASRVGGLDLGFTPGQGGLDFAGIAGGGADLVFNLGADEVDVAPGAFVVYIGTHGDRGAHRADVILPGAAYTEKSGTFVNTEGRVQMGIRASFPPGEAREDWAILRALSDQIGQRLPFDSLQQLRAALYKAHPHFAALDQIAPADATSLANLPQGQIGGGAFAPAISDFYLTNPIARASAVMAECSALAKGRTQQAAE